MPKVAEILAMAVQRHQAGDAAEAERLYYEVCQAEPEHADAHHLLGVLFYQQGRREEAVAAFSRAVALRPAQPDFRNNFGLALQSIGRLEEAAENYQIGLRLQPDMAETHTNLGNVLFRKNRSGEAASQYRAALRLQPQNAKAYCGLGLALASLGHSDEAEAAYQNALYIHPDFAEVHNNLASLYLAQGRMYEAIAHGQKSLVIEPGQIEASLNLGRAYVSIKQWTDAERCFREALAHHAACADAHHGLAYTLDRQGLISEAISSYQQALELLPESAEVLYDLGNALSRQGNLAGAIDCYRRALQFRPDFAIAWNNLGFALALQEKWEEAAAALREAVRFQPDYAEAHCNLANALLRAGIAAEAEIACEVAIRLRPDYAVAYCTLGSAQQMQGKMIEAATSFEHALELQPDLAEAQNGLGALLVDAGLPEDPIPYFRQAIALKPNYAEAHENLANQLALQGMLEEAEEHFRESLRLKPTAEKRVAAALRIPPIYQSVADLQAWRERLLAGIRELRSEGVIVDLQREPAVGTFYTAYHGLNDRELQRDLASLFRPPPDVAAGRPRGSLSSADKIRVGFISRFFKEHTIGRLNRGLIAQLSRERFHVAVLSIGHHTDALADFIRKHADEYLELPPKFAHARQAIADLNLDVLYFTDVGMETATYTLAFSRLAPVQCVTWGHPVTTGIPAMAYFISSEWLESDKSGEHYTEKLVRLKNLAIYFYRPGLPAEMKNREHFGLPANGTLYLCPQSLFKFHPEFDDVLAGILRRDPSGTLGLIKAKYPQWDQMLMRRFQASMPDVVERVCFVPAQNHAGFMNLNALADVLLDPIHFGGGNTSYEGFALGKPIITLPSKFLRGRITLALYKQMGIMDCVASSKSEYVDLAERLGTDQSERERVSKKILAASDELFENLVGVRELEEFFTHAVATSRQKEK